MSEEKAGGSSAATSKPKAEAEERSYTILAAVGPKDADPDGLDWKVIAKVKATTQGKAKEAVLAENPSFPGLDPEPSGSGAGGVDPAAQPTDLQSLVRGNRLWLHAESGWTPKLVEIDQPPPRFSGL